MALGLQDRINGRFATPELFLSDLDAGAAANLITAAADVVLIVDDAGVIRDLAFGNDELLSHGCNDWLGKTWAQYDLAEFGARSPVRFQPKNSDGWFRMDLRKGWIERAEVLFLKPKA